MIWCYIALLGLAYTSVNHRYLKLYQDEIFIDIGNTKVHSYQQEKLISINVHKKFQSRPFLFWQNLYIFSHFLHIYENYYIPECQTSNTYNLDFSNRCAMITLCNRKRLKFSDSEAESNFRQKWSEGNHDYRKSAFTYPIQFSLLVIEVICSSSAPGPP